MKKLDIDLLNNTSIRIAGAVSESVVDGPGIRYTVFTQGCPFRCKGCHNPQAQSLTGGMDVCLKALYDELKANPLVTGVTFSGGEPFIQAKSLSIFAKILKEDGFNLWSYSGFTFEKIIKDPEKLKLLEFLDVIVDGPFIMSKKSLMIDFRGSTNQRIIDVKNSLKEGKVILMPGFV